MFWHNMSFLRSKDFIIYLFVQRAQASMCVSRGGAEAEGERESLKQAPCPAQDPTRALDLTTLRLWPEPKSRVGRLTNGATQEPLTFILFTIIVSLLDFSYFLWSIF